LNARKDAAEAVKAYEKALELAPEENKAAYTTILERLKGGSERK